MSQNESHTTLKCPNIESDGTNATNSEFLISNLTLTIPTARRSSVMVYVVYYSESFNLTPV